MRMFCMGVFGVDVIVVMIMTVAMVVMMVVVIMVVRVVVMTVIMRMSRCFQAAHARTEMSAKRTIRHV
jgi:hypothetical protein